MSGRGPVPHGGGLRALLLREWVHGAMLLGALVGIAWTSGAAPRTAAGGLPAVWIWLVLTPLYGLACVAAAWKRVPDWPGRRRLMATQALHWAAVLLAMWAVLLPGAQVRLDAGTAGPGVLGLALLLLLALGTFLAGVHAWSLGICGTGAVLALAIPALVWLDRVAVLLLVILAVVVAAAAIWVWRRRAGTPPAAGP